MIGASLLASALGRRIAAGALGLALLGGAAWWIYGKGRAAGQQQGRAEQLEQDRKGFDLERQAFLSRLAAAEQREAHALSLLREAQKAVERANERLAAIESKREADRQNVHSLADAELFADLTRKLAVRAPTDPTPTFYPAELRRADLIITDYPNLQQQNQTLGEKLAALESQVGALSQQVQAVVDQRDAAMQWGNQVVGHYVRAYNVAQKARKRPLILKILTLGLLRDPKLDLPEPISLERPRPSPDE